MVPRQTGVIQVGLGYVWGLNSEEMGAGVSVVGKASATVRAVHSPTGRHPTAISTIPANGLYYLGERDSDA